MPWFNTSFCSTCTCKLYMYEQSVNHNSLTREKPSLKSPTAQDTFWPIPAKPCIQAVCKRNGLVTHPGSNCIRIWGQGNYSCTRTSHEYLIMQWYLIVATWLFVMYKSIVASRTRYRLVLNGCCLVICRHTTCSRLTFAHSCWRARLTVTTTTLKQVLACTKSLSTGTCTVVVAYKSTEGVWTKYCSKR